MKKFFGGRKFLVLAVILAAILALFFWSRVDARDGLAIIGDHAGELAVGAGLTGLTSPDDASLLIVVVNDWTRLSYLPDLGPLCDSACGAQETFVRVWDLHPGGSREVLFFSLEVFGVEEPDLDCAGQTLGLVLRSAEMPNCAQGIEEPRARWILPFGFGTV